MKKNSDVSYHFIQIADEIRGVDTDEAKLVVGDRIRSARKIAGLTAKELGERLDPPVTQSGVSSWERGRTTPSSEMRDQLEKALAEWRDEIDRDRTLNLFYFIEFDPSPKRKEAKDKLLKTVEMLSVEGIEHLTEYAEFLAEKYPAIKISEPEKGEGE